MDAAQYACFQASVRGTLMANGRAALRSHGCAALVHERAAASERVANQRLGQG